MSRSSGEVLGGLGMFYSYQVVYLVCGDGRQRNWCMSCMGMGFNEVSWSLRSDASVFYKVVIKLLLLSLSTIAHEYHIDYMLVSTIHVCLEHCRIQLDLHM